jgi:hypothetical protein
MHCNAKNLFALSVAIVSAALGKFIAEVVVAYFVYHAAGTTMPRAFTNPSALFAGTVNTLTLSMVTRARESSKGKRCNLELVHKHVSEGLV